MRVLHYIELYPVKSETFIKNLITQVGNLGVENSLVLHYATEDIDCSQVRYEQIPYLRTIPHLIRNRIFSYREINNSKFLSEINRIKPDLIHAHFGINGIRIYKYLRRKKILTPLVISLHGTDLVHIKRNKILKEIFIKILMDQETSLIVPSQFLYESVISVGVESERIKVIPNAVDKIFEKNLATRTPNEFRITNIGRFIPLKGQKNLIDAFYQVSKVYPITKLKIVGYGPLENEIREQLTLLGLSNKVEIISSASPEEIREILNQTDLYIQPSILGSSGERENLAVSVLEAQMSGCPCVVSEIGGLPETIANDSTGTTVKPGSVSELKAAIIRYIEDSNLWNQHSVNAKANATQRFSESTVYPQVVDLYADTINSTKRIIPRSKGELN
jgi:glycosyltransferase involved in cell wall biosynthesis